jgi:hypothetical protein
MKKFIYYFIFFLLLCLMNSIVRLVIEPYLINHLHIKSYQAHTIIIIIYFSILGGVLFIGILDYAKKVLSI